MDRKKIQGDWFKMAEEKDMCSPPPVRAVKLQLAVENYQQKDVGTHQKKISHV